MSGQGILTVDVSSVANALLCMEPSLAQAYLTAIKNVDACHTHGRYEVHSPDHLSCVEPHQWRALPHTTTTWGWLQEEDTAIKKLLDYRIGDTFFKDGNYAGARRPYSEALAIDATAVRWASTLHSNRAAAYMGSEQFEEAVRDCHAAISKDGAYSRAYLRRARAFRALRDYSSSVRDYRKYLTMLGDHPRFEQERTTVGQELQSVLSAQKRKTHEDMERQAREQRQRYEQQQRERYSHYGNKGQQQQQQQQQRSRGNGYGYGYGDPRDDPFYDSEEDEYPLGPLLLLLLASQTAAAAAAAAGELWGKVRAEGLQSLPRLPARVRRRQGPAAAAAAGARRLQAWGQSRYRWQWQWQWPRIQPRRLRRVIGRGVGPHRCKALGLGSLPARPSSRKPTDPWRCASTPTRTRTRARWRGSRR